MKEPNHITAIEYLQKELPNHSEKKQKQMIITLLRKVRRKYNTWAITRLQPFMQIYNDKGEKIQWNQLQNQNLEFLKELLEDLKNTENK